MAVLGLYTSVLISSKGLGASELASRASRQDWGEFVGACETVAAGEIESFESDWVIDSSEAIVVAGVWNEREEEREEEEEMRRRGDGHLAAARIHRRSRNCRMRMWCECVDVS